MAASTGTKEYTLRINGVTQNVSDVTKLEDVLKSLDATIGDVNKSTVKEVTVTKDVTKAITEEEKAAKRLADTKKKVESVNSAVNKAQIEANIELRERTRELTRQIQINALAEGSITQMGMTLTNLRNEYEDLSAAERNETEVGGKLLAQIQALDAEYKGLRESTGNFRDSVGNYEKALSGLNKLQDGLEKAGESSTELAADLVGSNEVLDLVSTTSETLAATTAHLTTIMTLASSVQEAYTLVTQEGYIVQKASAIMDGVRAVQLRAKTAAEALSTKGTIAATIAQFAFNVVANANPYVLLAVALVTVVGALALFAGNTENAADKQKELNELEAAFLKYLEAEAASLKLVSDSRIKFFQRQVDILKAQGGELAKIRKIEDDIAKERRTNNTRLIAMYTEEVEGLEANRAKLKQYYDMLLLIEQAKARGEDEIYLDVDLNGGIDRLDVAEAVDAVQGKIDVLDKKIQIAVGLKTEQADIRAELQVVAAERLKADKDAAKAAAEEYKKRADAAKAAAKERAGLELEAVRAAEDARIKLIENGYEEARKLIKTQYARDIEDLRTKLATQDNLTAKARKAINDNILSLQLLLNKELDELEKARAAKELETARELEDTRNAIILGQADRARAEINAAYGRRIEDLQKRLDTEKDLTESQQKAISEEMLNIQIARGRALDAVTLEQIQTRTNQELTGIEFALTQAQNKIGDFTARNKNGLRLIDVEKTQQNITAANDALSNYINGLTHYRDELKTTHDATLASLQEGTTEYAAEVQKFAAAEEDVNQRIKKAQSDRAENTKQSVKVQADYFRDLLDKVGDYAKETVDALGGVFDAWNGGVQMQIEALGEQLEVLGEKYEEAQKQREDAVKNVEDLELQLQAATGGTAEALKEQLTDAMHARNEAEREEKRLAKEKEKREEDIRKKEKQIRRNDLIAGIAQGIANTAQAVTKALTLVWPLNLLVAGLVGAAGAVQVGLMTKQLTKLADGGEIKGPSHAQGGVDIGLGYEAEGGEFMINKRSYGANADLIKFINDSPGTLALSDLMGIIPADNTPAVSSSMGQGSDGRLIEAIEAINITPVVSVQEINDVNDQLTTIKDLSDY